MVGHCARRSTTTRDGNRHELTGVATVTVSMGMQRDLLTDRTSKSLVFQVALKTVY